MEACRNTPSTSPDRTDAADHASALDPYRDRAATVMGLGLFGGGVGAARYLVSRGARVTVTDMKSAEALAPSVRALAGMPITFHLGGHVAPDFTQADLVVVNPAVDKQKSEFVRMAEAAGAELTSEMNLFFPACPAPIVGITGSSGKSTTTALLGDMLARCRPTRVGGNIGKSLLEDLPDIRPDETVVLELSSFQLEDLARVGRSPQLAIVTCISPNHLDRHGTMPNYIDAKKTILRFQRAGDAAVLNFDDAEVRRWEAEARAAGSRAVFYSAREALAEGVFADGSAVVFRLGGDEERVDLAGKVHLLGRHNLSNILAAAAGARLLGAPPDEIAGAVAAFRALPHRLEPVGRLGGVLFVNDSKATTPVAAQVSMDAFEGPVVLIAGGRDKHMDMRPLVEAIRRRTRAVVLIGEMAGRIEESLGPRPGRTVERAATIEAAVARAAALALPGDVVLLAPAYTSWDMFNNYEERGDAFRGAVLGLGAQPLDSHARTGGS